MFFLRFQKRFSKLYQTFFFLQISVFRPKNTFKKHCLVFKLLITFHGKSIDDAFFQPDWTGACWESLGQTWTTGWLVCRLLIVGAEVGLLQC